MKSQIVSAGALLALTACGSGGAIPNSPASTVAQTAPLSIVLHVPGEASSAQHAQYISASTKGIGISVGAHPATFPGVTTPQFAFDVSGTSTYCTGTPPSRTCTLPISAALIGSDDVQITAWDHIPSAGSFAGAKRLSSVTVTSQTVTKGVANTVNATLTAAVASIALSLSSTSMNASPSSAEGGSPQTATLTVKAYDAAGNLIVGGGGLTDASGNALSISIGQSATSNGGSVLTTLSSSTVTSSGSTIKVTYPGGSTWGTVFTATPSRTITGTNTAATLAMTPTITEFSSGITANSSPQGIGSGSDGNLWFTQGNGTNHVARMTPTGTVTEYSSGISGTSAFGDIVQGSDGDMWFSEFNGSAWLVAKITTGGSVTEYSGISGVQGLAEGADGDVWFADQANKKIGKISTSGSVTEYSVTTAPSNITNGPSGNLSFLSSGGTNEITTAGVATNISATAGNYIAAGTDGNLWETSFAQNFIAGVWISSSIMRVTTGGATTTYSLTASAQPYHIMSGPDGSLWFAEYNGNKIGRITTAGSVTEYTVPSSSAEPFGITSGPDGNIWFTEVYGNRIGRLIY